MGFSSDVVGGPLVIEGAQVKIFTKQSGVRGSYTAITCPTNIVAATWVGDEIVITLDDGQVRQYSTTGMYH